MSTFFSKLVTIKVKQKLKQIINRNTSTQTFFFRNRSCILVEAGKIILNFISKFPTIQIKQNDPSSKNIVIMLLIYSFFLIEK